MKKIVTRVAICLPVLCFAFSLTTYAQALSSEDIKSQMVKDWERAKAYTIEYLNTMPADKYSFKANDSIRSFAQQMLHLSSGNVGLMAVASDEKPPALPFTLEQRTSAQTKDSVMYFITTSYDYCINAVKKSDPSKWGEKKKFFNYDETRYTMMTKTFEHQTHHRGQTTIYIRLVGIKPPQEKLF